MLKNTGKILIVVLVLITIGLFLLSKNDLSLALSNRLLFVSQLLSLVGTTLLSITLVLGSRARFLEEIFGGLDKVNNTHQNIGAIAFVALIHHPMLLAIRVLPDIQLASKYLFFSNNLAYNHGITALYLMILILALTLVIKLPYNVWIKTHDMFGIVLFFASLHILSISSDVSRFLPLRIWLMSLLTIGMYFYIYKIFLYRWVGPKYHYTVDKIKELGEVMEIYLKPKTQKLAFKPGQFAFVNFQSLELDETHPFSFSSSPNENIIRFSVKTLGDFTSKLKKLNPGTNASLWGSYGRMYDKFRGSKDVVFIAGGIGVTPFLSMLAYETSAQLSRKITIFYSARTQADGVYHEELSSYANFLNNYKYYPFFGDQKPRLTIEDIKAGVGNFEDKVFYLCGPEAMMDSFTKQLIDNGVKKSNIIFENFTFKK